MKTLYASTLLLLFSLFFSYQSEAQDFGGKGGLNFHTIYGEDTEDAGLRAGLHLGGFGQFELSDGLFLRPELLYSLEGVRYSEDEFVSRTDFHFLAIPVMARYSLDGLYFEGGPSFGLLLGGRGVFKNTDSGDKETSDLDMDEFRTMELAFEFGGGYQLDNGIDIGLRFDLGLSGLYDFSEVPDDFRDEVNNINSFGIRLSGGYTF